MRTLKSKLNQYSKFKDGVIMTVAESINNAILEGDIKGLRIMMKNSLLVDPTFAEFNEMESLTRNVKELYDIHDGRELNENKSAWNDDYMNKLMVQVVGNFSHERLDILKEVVRYLRPVIVRQRQAELGDRIETKQASLSQTSPIRKSSYYDQKAKDERDNRIISGPCTKIAAGAVVGGIVGGAIAGLAGAAGVVVLASATAGAVAAGVVIAVTSNKE